MYFFRSRKALLTIIEEADTHPDDYYISERSLLRQQESFFKEGGTCGRILAALNRPEDPDEYDFPPPLGELLISKCTTKLQRDFGKDLSANLVKSPVPVYLCLKTEVSAKTRDAKVRCRKIN